MHEVLVNRLGGLSLPRKSGVRLTDRPHMTLDVYRGRKTTMHYISSPALNINTGLPGVLALTKHSLLKVIRFIVWPNYKCLDQILLVE